MLGKPIGTPAQLVGVVAHELVPIRERGYDAGPAELVEQVEPD
ncbi:hypothetical protein ACPPVO_53935 [Dactylosporangium sp. McL0621]